MNRINHSLSIEPAVNGVPHHRFENWQMADLGSEAAKQPLDRALSAVAAHYDQSWEFRGPQCAGKTTLLDVIAEFAWSGSETGFTRVSPAALDQIEKRLRHGSPVPTRRPEADGEPAAKMPVWPGLEFFTFRRGPRNVLVVSYPHEDPRRLDTQATARLYRDEPHRRFLPVVQPFRAICDLPRPAAEATDLRDVTRAAFGCVFGWPAERMAELDTNGLVDFLADDRLVGATLERGRRAQQYRLRGPRLSEAQTKVHLQTLVDVTVDVVRQERLVLQPVREILQSLKEPLVVVTHADFAKRLDSAWLREEWFKEVFAYMLGRTHRSSRNCLLMGNLVQEIMSPESGGKAKKYVFGLETAGAEALLASLESEPSAEADERGTPAPERGAYTGPSFLADPEPLDEVARQYRHASEPKPVHEGDEQNLGAAIKEFVFRFGAGSAWLAIGALGLAPFTGPATAFAALLWAVVALAVGCGVGVAVRLQWLGDLWAASPRRVALRNVLRTVTHADAGAVTLWKSWLGELFDVAAVTVGKNRIRTHLVPQARRFRDATGLSAARTQTRIGQNAIHLIAMIGFVVLALLARHK